jgi:hypothetical protein
MRDTSSQLNIAIMALERLVSTTVEQRHVPIYHERIVGHSLALLVMLLMWIRIGVVSMIQ